MKPTKIVNFLLIFAFMCQVSQSLLATSGGGAAAAGSAAEAPQTEFLHIFHNLNNFAVQQEFDFAALENHILLFFEIVTGQSKRGVQTNYKLYVHAPEEIGVVPFLEASSNYEVETIVSYDKTQSTPHPLVNRQLNLLSDMCTDLKKHVFIFMGFSEESCFLKTSLDKIKRQGARFYFLATSYNDANSFVFNKSPQACFLWPSFRPTMRPRFIQQILASQVTGGTDAAVEIRRPPASEEPFIIRYGNISKKLGKGGEETLALVEENTNKQEEIKKEKLDHPYHWFDRLPLYDPSKQKETSYAACWRQTNRSREISDIRLAGTVLKLTIPVHQPFYGFISHPLYPKNLYFNSKFIDKSDSKTETDPSSVSRGKLVYFRVHVNSRNGINQNLSAGRVFPDPHQVIANPFRGHFREGESGSGGGGWD